MKPEYKTATYMDYYNSDYRGSVVLIVKHVGRCLTPRDLGGLGSMKLPLLADFSKKMARDFGVLVEDEGIALRYSSD